MIAHVYFHLDRQEQFIRWNNLNYGAEDKEHTYGEKGLFTVASQLNIDLQPKDIQREHRLGQKRRNKNNPRPIIARFCMTQIIARFVHGEVRVLQLNLLLKITLIENLEVQSRQIAGVSFNITR